MRRLISQSRNLRCGLSYSTMDTRSECADTTHACGPLVARLPADGSAISAANFRRLVDDVFPDRSYQALGCFTARELCSRCPSLFALQEQADGWYTVSARSRATVAPLRLGVLPTSPQPLRDVLPQEALSMSGADVLSALRADPTIEVGVEAVVRPIAKARGAHIFIDGDSVDRETVQRILAHLKITTVSSSRVVVRQASSAAHSAQDVVCRAPGQTFQVVEAHLDQLISGTAKLLKGVVIVCGHEHFSLFQSVAERVGGQCDVLLCSPEAMVRCGGV